MMFLEGSAMLLAGMWLIRRINRAQPQPRRSGPDPDLEYSLKMAELEYQAATQKAEMDLLEIKEREAQSDEGRELDRWWQRMPSIARNGPKQRSSPYCELKAVMRTRLNRC